MVNNNKVTSFVNALNGLVDGKEDVANKVTSITSSSTNTHYPTAKAVYDALQNIGDGVDIVTSWEQTLSDEKVPSEKLVKNSLDLKSDSTHTHSQYLTEHQSLTDYVQKSSTTGLLKNDGTVMESGTGASNFALGNHNHTGTYANSNHNHNIADLNNVTTVTVTVTYTDDTTENIQLLKYTGS